ncbi:MAG: hypothetical protein IJ851_04640 [Eubacterium sp.]|nr:hypothetical protein [Eubacterium sp.]
MEENREINIDLRRIFTMLKRKIVYILLITVIGAILSGAYTNFFVTPMYTATVQLHVYSSADNRLGTDSSITKGELDASQQLINTYIVVVKSNTFLEKVSDKLGSDRYSASAIKGMLSCAPIENTVAFSISITNPDPETAMEIANTIADTCPDEIVRVLKVGGVEIIDYAKLPSSPSSPNIRKNVAFGAAIAFALSFAFFFVKELFDTSIKEESDLTREFDIPILGTIPRLVAIDKPGYGTTASETSSNSNEKEDK